jgi:hypothetical protein
MASFHGSIQELKQLVVQTGVDGHWDPISGNRWRFACANRGGLYWAHATGRVWFYGPPHDREELESLIERALTAEPA